MKRKILIEKTDGQVRTFLLEDDTVVEIHCSDPERKGAGRHQIGDIYIGKVKNIVKNIGAAFIDLGGIMGYYSLADNPVPVYADGRKTGNALRPGDELIVQIARDAVKS